MAVIQISKIQVRRGKKNSDSGVPQLSSAEFAWAIDSQELYIGNGSLAEGAPFVGNTKILTEHDNILELAGSYRFGVGNSQIIQSVPRSLQDKIDEIAVSIEDFVDPEEIDAAKSLEKATEDLFTGTDPKLKKVLIIPNGEYTFLSNITLPSGVILKGETRDGSILNINSQTLNFISGSKHVSFENLTIQFTAGHIDMTGVSDSKFQNVQFKSNYILSNSEINLENTNAGIFWENTNNITTKVNNIKFDNCVFDSLTLAIKVRQTAITSQNYSTEIFFQDCLFRNCHGGVLVLGKSKQEHKWLFDNCRFEEIATQAFKSTFGIGTVFRDSSFKKCGNGNSLTPKVEMVSFGEYRGNELINCSSDRVQFTTVNSTVGVPIVLNANKAVFTDMIYSEISLVDAPTPLLVFGLNAQYLYNPLTDSFETDVVTYMSCYKIEYILRLGVGMRKGVLVIGVDNGNGEGPNISLSDNFTYSSSSSTSEEGVRMTEFKFYASVRDNNNDGNYDTVLLSYRNPVEHTIDEETTISGEPGDITFSVCYGV